MLLMIISLVVMELVIGASQVVLAVKNSPANAGNIRDMVQPLGQEDSPGEGNDNPLQYCCLKTPMATGAWGVTVHGVALYTYSIWASILIFAFSSQM